MIASLFWLKLLAHKTRGSAAAAVGKIKKKKKTQSNTYVYIALFMVPVPPMPFKSGRSVASSNGSSPNTYTHIYKTEERVEAEK